MTENIGHHGHDDQHDEQPYDYRIEDAEPGREIEEWIVAIISKPWFAALKSLPGDRGLWVGTDGRHARGVRPRQEQRRRILEDFRELGSNRLPCLPREDRSVQALPRRDRSPPP
jgi:hypothetical protein